LAATATALAGCGTAAGGTAVLRSGSNNSAQPPKAELRSAFDALGQAPTLTTTVAVGATADEVSSLAGAFGIPMSSSEAATLAGARISVEVAAPRGKTVGEVDGTGSGAATSVTFDTAGTTLLAMRNVDNTVYLQADVKALLTMMGKSVVYDGLEATRAMLPSVGKALLDGQWISIPSGTLGALRILGGSGSGSLSDGPPAGMDASLDPLLTTLFNQDVTVSRLSAGTTDRLAVSVNSRAVARTLLSKVAANLPFGGRWLVGSAAAHVPSQTVTMTANVVGGALSELSMNLGRYDSADVPVDLAFTRTTSTVTAPARAVAADSLQLTELMGVLAAGSVGSSLL
jgi:hypothetical protein